MLSLRRESRQWAFHGSTVFMMTNGLLGVSDDVGARMERVSSCTCTVLLRQSSVNVQDSSDMRVGEGALCIGSAWYVKRKSQSAEQLQ